MDTQTSQNHSDANELDESEFAEDTTDLQYLDWDSETQDNDESDVNDESADEDGDSEGTVDDQEEESEEQEGEEESEEQETTPKKATSNFERRVKRLNSEVEYWKQQALAVNPNAGKQVQTTKPTLAQFNGDTDKFEEAMIQYAEQQVIVKKQQEAFQQKQEQFKAQAEDYDDAMQELALFVRTKQKPMPELDAYLNESDYGPQVYYHLANHLDELEKIMNLSPLKRVAAIAKLEDRLSVAGATPKPAVQQKITKAKAPIKPEKGSTVKRVDPDDDNLSQAEWARLEDLREQKRLRP